MTRWTPGGLDQGVALGPQRSALSIPYLLLLGLGAVVLGVATAFQPLLVLVGVAATLVVAWVTARPVRGAYLLVLVVPLVVGMSRGLVVPVLRPNELLLLLLLGLAVVWGTFRTDSAVRLGPFTVVDAAFGLLFVFGSLVPLAVLLYRNNLPSVEDSFQLLSLLKYYVGYRLILALVPGEREMLAVARLMVAASVMVAVIGLLQVERLFDVAEWLATYYSAEQVRESLESPRATSTLGVWHALGAYLAVHATLAMALLAPPTARGIWRWGLIAALVVDVLGALATLTITAVLALVIGLGLMAVFGRQVRRTTLAAVPVVLAAVLLLRPAIEERWAYQFASPYAGGPLPVTWESRLSNLTTVFWPAVQNDLVFGVAPSVSPDLPWQYVENQVMSLLYQGGLLYAGAYLLFMVMVLRTTWGFLRRLEGPALAVARTAFIAWLLILVLGLFDPHLTMAGEADAAWALLALASGAAARAGGG